MADKSLTSEMPAVLRTELDELLPQIEQRFQVNKLPITDDLVQPSAGLWTMTDRFSFYNYVQFSATLVLVMFRFEGSLSANANTLFLRLPRGMVASNQGTAIVRVSAPVNALAMARTFPNSADVAARSGAIELNIIPSAAFPAGVVFFGGQMFIEVVDVRP